MPDLRMNRRVVTSDPAYAIGKQGTPPAECEVERGHQSGRRADDGGDGIHQPHGGRQNPLIGVAATTPGARQTEVQPQ